MDSRKMEERIEALLKKIEMLCAEQKEIIQKNRDMSERIQRLESDVERLEYLNGYGSSGSGCY